jgi:anaerobic selenocysteine-containing dehydrogenase
MRSRDGDDVTVRRVPSICRLCHNLCAIEMTIDGTRILDVTGDRANPGSSGYTCVKGRAIPEIFQGGRRLLTSMVRSDDGFTPIGSEQAMDEIAQRLSSIVAQHGPRSVAIYTGTMAFIASEPTAPVMTSFADALGTPMRFTPLTIDMPGKSIAYALHGVWMAPTPGLPASEVGLLIGVNPLVSHVIGPSGHPGHWMGEALGRGLQLVVIDPRRTETARRAAIHLQPRPGYDSLLVAAMLKMIIDEARVDTAFVAEHVRGFEALERVLAAVDPAEIAASAEVELDDLTHAARMFADANFACGLVGTGANMAQSGTLLEYLVLVMQTLCGHWPRAGERVANPGTLRMALPATAQARDPMAAFDIGELLVARNLRGSIAGLPTAALPDEMLTDGPSRVRALICVGGNPAVAWPDHTRTLDALRSLDLLVQVDPFMSQTASMAHYVIAPKVAHERASTSQFVADLTSGGGFGRSFAYGQYVDKVLDPPVGSDVIEEWELFHGLARRMGLTLAIGPMLNYSTPVPGVAPVPLATDPKPTTEQLLEILCGGARIPLDEVKRHPHGAAFPDPPTIVQPKEPGWAGRLDVGNADLMSDLGALITTATACNDAFPFRLLSRRMMHVYNSSYNVASTHRGRAFNPLFVHPADLERLGMCSGDVVDVRSACGSIRAIVSADTSTLSDPTVRQKATTSPSPARRSPRCWVSSWDSTATAVNRA